MAGIASIAEAITAKRWTPQIAGDLVGPFQRCVVAHAADESVRNAAASGGAVTALLLEALASGVVDGCLVGRTVVEDGCARLNYSVATNAEEVLAAQGSTYVVGDFVREALPLIAAHPGRLAVVCLPCEATVLARRPQLAERVGLVIGLFCGHATSPQLVDHLTDHLSREVGAPLTGLRFRSGHWRGKLIARFDNGAVIEKPFSAYGRSQNLYYAAARKCLFCGDHFGYNADICAGDLWSSRFKNDPIKHTALVAKTDRGVAAMVAAERRAALETADVDIYAVLDGQRRVAPFHFNVSARSRAGKALGINIPDHGQKVAWHEYLAARIVLKNAEATRTPEGLARMLALPGWYQTLMLYVLKGLESLS